MSNFIRDNIFCRLGIPKRILSDSDTPFINSTVRELCEKYGVDHVKSTPYFPQDNGQAEATNKTLMRILSRMVYDEPKRWAEFIPLVLWAYRTSKRTSRQATTFSLVYGAEAVVLVEILEPSARLALTSKINDSRERVHDVEAIEEKRTETEQ